MHGAGRVKTKRLKLLHFFFKLIFFLNLTYPIKGLRFVIHGWVFDFSELIFELNNFHDAELTILYLLNKTKIYSL